ncbi:hypothetical protein Bca101_057257 [Brassica carinata]
MDPTGNSSLSSVRKNGNKNVASSAKPKPNGKSIDSSAAVEKPKEKTALLSTNSMKPNAATALSSAHGEQVMFFRDVSLGPHEAVGTVIQGFVPAGRVGSFDLTAGSVYKLVNFFGSRNKVQYQVADHKATLSFSWNYGLSVLENPPVQIAER